MFDFITGSVERTNGKEAVVECGGIGYLLTCSYNTLIRLSENKLNTKVYTYFAVRENACELYGFYSLEEREMFKSLTNVSKVGPKAALSILSMFSPKEVVKLIVNSDVKNLSKPSGVGKKLAENIIFSLKNKFGEEDAAGSFFEVPEDPMFSAGVKDEAMLALTSLGFERSVAIKLVNECYSQDQTVEELVASALKSAAN